MPKRNASSLRWMLIDRLLPAMLGLLLLGALAANWVALRAATKAYDRGLLDTAFAIAEQLQMVDGKLQLPLAPQARAVLQPYRQRSLQHVLAFHRFQKYSSPLHAALCW